MKARPILFQGAMVRALLDGSKTQTRRLCKPMNAWVQQDCREVRMIDGQPFHFLIGAESPIERLRSPYGQPGDRLWVRETTEIDEQRSDAVVLSRYSADGAPVLMSGCDDPEFNGAIAHWDYPRRSRPSIHMPRWASRILLEIVSVRVERLNDISEADAYAEGVEPEIVPVCCGEPHHENHGVLGVETYCCGSPIEDEKAVPAYEKLWESINGAGSWSENPFVWVVTFNRVTP